MKKDETAELITKIFDELEESVPQFKDSPDDWRISEGNVAICIITEDGRIHGKVFGDDKIRQRQYYNVAYKKASQVWITGHSTGEYEKIVFGGEMNPQDSPIALPDLIGWVGGQPIDLEGGQRLSVGFSGFRGFNDIEIVKKAIAKVTA